ncbi:glycosyltransferase 87 family protein [Kutzneria sp. CA-103260]|uniref:glycosyltransferase 87 family protein n=1 Tax=Kutzneria sp. CA-103260 TaxID=2802641 RepID=UPI001BAA7BF7|nr:glycosyltransferase 87 family protein [Kutzneria sp. CA-103260]
MLKRICLLAAAVVAVCYGVTYHLDLDVYRIGASVLLHGGDLYGPLPGVDLPFTYPPFAAVLFTPLTLVPLPVVGAVITVISLGCLALVLRTATVSRLWWLVGPAALLFEPARSTLMYGQINLALMALVVVDCLAVSPRWPRGLLIGLAAAIKLTPAVFVLYLLLRRDFRAAAVSAVTFVLVAGFGFLVSWRASVEYWTRLVFDSSRVGGSAFTTNQSIKGVLARYGLDHQTWLWALLAGTVVALGAIGIHRAISARQHVRAVALTGLVGLLVSPVSWSHHWVWAVLLVLGLRRRVLAALLFAIGPFWLLPQSDNRELLWTPWQQLLGNSYVWFGVALVLVEAVRGQYDHRRASNPSDGPAVGRGAHGLRHIESEHTSG